MQAIFFVKPLSIGEILDKMSDALKESLPEQAVLTITITTSFGADTLAINANCKELPNNEAIRAKIKTYKKRAYLEAQHVYFNLQNQ